MSEGEAHRPPKLLLPTFVLELAEPWMDVLLIGISPAALAKSGPGCRNAHPSKPPPTRPWDLIIARSRGADDSLPRALEEALPQLRAGGWAVLLLPRESPGSRPLVAALTQAMGSRVFAQETGDQLVLRGKSPAAMGEDSVSLRRLVVQHLEASARLEELEPALLEAQANAPDEALGERILELLGLLGDIDRFWGLPIALRLSGREAGDALDPDTLAGASNHAKRPLDELVTRFRHFRAQSWDALREMSELPPRKRPPDAGDDSLLAHLEAWKRRDQAVFQEIKEICRAIREA